MLTKIDNMIEPLRKLANCVGSPLWNLAARLYLANVFFNVGRQRLNSWDSQSYLFTEEHPVPGIPADIAAPLTVSMELFLPVLLALGLFGRAGAAGVLIMLAVIEFTYMHSADHIFWAFLASAIFIKGPGRLSVDHYLLKFIRKGG